MHVANERLAASILSSQTLILRGSASELLRYLSEQEDLQLDEPVINASR
jgi:hypothetical protein